MASQCVSLAIPTAMPGGAFVEPVPCISRNVHLQQSIDVPKRRAQWMPRVHMNESGEARGQVGMNLLS